MKPGILWAVRATVAAQAVVLLYQGVAVGVGSLATSTSAEVVLLHVIAALQLVVTLLVWRPGGGPWWPAAMSAAILGAGLVQTTVGSSLALHVPLAVVLVGAVFWVLGWSFFPQAPEIRAATPTA